MTSDLSVVPGGLAENAGMRTAQLATAMAAGAVDDRPCAVKRKC